MGSGEWGRLNGGRGRRRSGGGAWSVNLRITAPMCGRGRFADWPGFLAIGQSEGKSASEVTLSSCRVYDLWSGSARFPFEKGTEIGSPSADSRTCCRSARFPFEKGTEIYESDPWEARIAEKRALPLREGD